jgi:putative tricarboxylic transport membrane protein
MHSILSRDFVGGIAAVLIGTFYLSLAYDLRSSALDDLVGPGGMPRAYGWVMVLLGVALSGAALVAQWRQQKTDHWKDQGRRIMWAAGLLGIGIAYLLIVNVLGYLLSMILLIAATMIYHGERFSTKVLATSAFGGVFLWALFVFVLGVHMPPGLLTYIGL